MKEHRDRENSLKLWTRAYNVFHSIFLIVDAAYIALFLFLSFLSMYCCRMFFIERTQTVHVPIPVHARYGAPHRANIVATDKWG